VRIGRTLVAVTSEHGTSYQVAFPNGTALLLPETAFHVRSYLNGADPVATLAALAQETPFLFDRRREWLTRYARQVEFSQGLCGLVSSKIELFPHQVEVVRRVLQDPNIRYLLADEVGLGKTVEAGVILRQLRLDSPQIPINVFAPDVLLGQWRSELAARFDLHDINVRPHAAILDFEATGGIIVIDEAHRILSSASRERLAMVTAPKRTPHLLLLSATPVLHHERELFELLNLLDPYAYPVGSFEQFQSRISRRRELGRALLGLSRSTKPAFIAKHAQRCAELLPEDPYVREAARTCSTAAGGDLAQDNLMRNVASLRIHLTETYRINRRLIRTRRAALIGAGDLLQLRREDPPLYQNEGELFTELWQTIEDWRIRAAAHVAVSGDTNRDRWVEVYLEMVQAAAIIPSSLSDFFASQPDGLSFSGAESVKERICEIGRRIGTEGNRRVVRQFARHYADVGRWVVFCGTAIRCNHFAQIFEEEWGGPTFVVTHLMDATIIATRLADFRASEHAVLIGDAVIEEGLNLQFAKGAFFVDLPFDPMRLEQRLGRLDRLDRRGGVRCISALSAEDPTVAFDTAWYEMLTKGFGLLTGSLADQQFLVERFVRELGNAAFEGGPNALIGKIRDVEEGVNSEREMAAEQDILDGIDVGDLRESSVWKSLEAGDEEESEFGDALGSYLDDNLGLKLRRGNAGPGRVGSVMQFGLHRYSDPLIPVTMLGPVGALAGRTSTVTRTLATADPVLDFLRPGHPLVEELRRLADWDERGQAFALWRKAPGVPTPVLVFRLGIQSFVDLGPVQQQIRDLGWDAVSSASLLRLIAGWFPPHYYRLFVDVDGPHLQRPYE
jgi:ATP-dependent helicase HepA